MDLVFKSRNITLTDDLRQLAEKKLGKLQRYFKLASRAEVEFALERRNSDGQQALVQVTLSANGYLVRVQERAEDVPTALDAVADKLRTKLTRYKEKLYGVSKGSTRRSKLAEPRPQTEASGEDGREVVRVKRFRLQPLTVEEALHRMEMLGHDFFLFLSSEDGQPCVVYRRSDGGYGLIQPEIP